MRKYLCALLAALMLLSFTALAEEESPAAEPGVNGVEITAVEEPSEEAPAGEAAPEASKAPAATPVPVTVRMGFEDGFALHLPEGWLYHRINEEMAEQGVVYCLSDAAGSGWLYIQIWSTDCADLDELKDLVDRTAQIQTSGLYDFNGTGFVVYDLTEGDVSCCATLLNGKALNLVFTPQSDADFMVIAAQILNTFEIL